MKSLDNDDEFLRLGVTAVLATIVIALILAALTSNPDQAFVKDRKNQCEVISKASTEDRIYCGKACSQEAQYVTYQCNNKRKYTILEALR